ncbi:MAG: AraC family transcriptional regulator [Coleofasciculus sp. S288]|nr:AraC family transcriptional regulator [Coleofasciculus sp. S288]
MQTLVTPSTKTVHLLKNGLHPPICSSQPQGWQNILVEEFCQPPGQEKYQSQTEHTLCLSLNRRPSRLSQVIGDRRYTSLCTKGDLSIAPAGALFFCKWDGEDQYLRIRIASQFLQKVAREAIEIDPDRVELLPEFRVRNPQIEQIGTMLLSELKNGGLAEQLYVDSLTNLLGVHLLRGYCATRGRVALYDGGLSERQLLQVTDYINDRLADDIKLSDLAQLLEMSQFHFSRLFKRSLGVTPHQYVLQQRVERAKQLLKQTELSVMEIALLCGFSSHSHLGKWFRQHTGMTPKAYRAS